MDYLFRCGCLKCSLSSDKGTYETHESQERRQKHFNLQRTKSNQPIKERDQQNVSPIPTSSDITNNNQSLNETNMDHSASSSSTTTTGHNNNDHRQLKLSSFTLEGIAELISQQKINMSSVIVLVGAGMSTAAGVPDFRSPNTGIYSNLQKYNLPRPELVFSIDYFKNNPAPFFDLSRSLLPSKLTPTLSHYFIRLLHEKGYLLRCYSQNVDGLESLTSLPKEKLCLAHGSFETGHCLRCNAEYPLSWMRSIVDDGGIPHCTKTKDCKGLVKPDIKFFGERLDGRFFRLVKEDFPTKCELLIIIGSSLTVMPFANLVQKVPAHCPRLLINKTKSGHDLPFLLRMFRPGDGLLYDKKGNTRDVAYIGDCDEACMKLAKLLGWDGELLQVAKKNNQQLELRQDNMPQ